MILHYLNGPQFIYPAVILFYYYFSHLFQLLESIALDELTNQWVK